MIIHTKDVLQKVKERFSIDIATESTKLQFIHIPPKRPLAKRFTLIMESWDTITMAWNALNQLCPTIYIDTTGCAFTFWVAKVLAGCHVVAYVHYPTISTDMLQLVWERRPSYNNAQVTTVSSYIKLVYYGAFAILYGTTGSLADLVMVNSTWTYNHIRSLWRGIPDSKLHIVYPPCNISVPRKTTTKRNSHWIVSIGQFRPEKDHALQIKSFAKLLQISDSNKKLYKLILIGSCRGSDDEGRVEALRRLAYEELQLPKSQMEFVVNPPFSTVQEYFQTCGVGLHTMWNEHFGIGIVEMMASGLLVVAHDSGGPKSDIIVIEPAETGFLASTADQYAQQMQRAACWKDAEQMRQRAQTSVKRFSDDVFQTNFVQLMKTISCK
mmetsp:Transcript_17189/g.26049  ORF Transcript_17189/g.26049 Transcript_17189/m.26049 type:complete len:382 (+) Transcript_17189:421-1566(+)